MIGDKGKVTHVKQPLASLSSKSAGISANKIALGHLHSNIYNKDVHKITNHLHPFI